MRVCLDAGHGYKRTLPTGARGNNLIEDDVALKFCDRLGHYLRVKKVEVVFTRPDRNFVELKARSKIAKQEKCDMFVSIHCNAAGSPDAHGVEALVVVDDKRSHTIAEGLFAVLVQAGLSKRGVKWDNQGQHSSLYVLRNTYARMPAVLLEVGFLTNRDDATRLKDKEWLEKLACNLANVIAP